MWNAFDAGYRRQYPPGSWEKVKVSTSLSTCWRGWGGGEEKDRDRERERRGGAGGGVRGRERLDFHVLPTAQGHLKNKRGR